MPAPSYRVRALSAEAAIARVREIHTAARVPPEFEPYCVGCFEAGGGDGAPLWTDCPTIRALDGP